MSTFISLELLAGEANQREDTHYLSRASGRLANPEKTNTTGLVDFWALAESGRRVTSPLSPGAGQPSWVGITWLAETILFSFANGPGSALASCNIILHQTQSFQPTPFCDPGKKARQIGNAVGSLHGQNRAGYNYVEFPYDFYGFPMLAG